MKSKAPPSPLQRAAIERVAASLRTAQTEANEAIRRATPSSMRPTVHYPQVHMRIDAEPSRDPQLSVEYRIGPSQRPVGPMIGLLLLAFFVAAAGIVALAGAHERRTIATPVTEWRDR